MSSLPRERRDVVMRFSLSKNRLRLDLGKCRLSSSSCRTVFISSLFFLIFRTLDDLTTPKHD